MPFGGYAPSPERYGGGKPTIKSIHESLNLQRGTAYDVSGSVSPVWVENLAIARMLWDVWETNQRLANMWDPNRMTLDLVARWEKICGIAPLPSDTAVSRRARLAKKFSRVGQGALMSRLTSELTTLLGPVFVKVQTIPFTDAVMWWPGGTPSTTAPWYSTVAHILVKTTKPSGYTEAQYYDAVAKVFPLLEELAPSWVTFDFYRDNTNGNVGVWGQDASAGFWLDHPITAGGTPNLDNMVFDA